MNYKNYIANYFDEDGKFICFMTFGSTYDEIMAFHDWMKGCLDDGGKIEVIKIIRK